MHLISLHQIVPKRREYLSPTLNVLTKCLKNFQALTVTLSNAITFRVINEYGKGAVVEIKTVFCPVFYVASQVVL